MHQHAENLVFTTPALDTCQVSAIAIKSKEEKKTKQLFYIGCFAEQQNVLILVPKIIIDNKVCINLCHFLDIYCLNVVDCRKLAQIYKKRLNREIFAALQTQFHALNKLFFFSYSIKFIYLCFIFILQNNCKCIHSSFYIKNGFIPVGYGGLNMLDYVLYQKNTNLIIYWNRLSQYKIMYNFGKRSYPVT